MYPFYTKEIGTDGLGFWHIAKNPKDDEQWVLTMCMCGGRNEPIGVYRSPHEATIRAANHTTGNALFDVIKRDYPVLVQQMDEVLKNWERHDGPESRQITAPAELWETRSDQVAFKRELQAVLTDAREDWMSLFQDACDDRSSVDDSSVTIDDIELRNDGTGLLHCSFEEYWNPGCRDALSNKEHQESLEFVLDEANSVIIVMGLDRPVRDPDTY